MVSLWNEESASVAMLAASIANRAEVVSHGASFIRLRILYSRKMYIRQRIGSEEMKSKQRVCFKSRARACSKS